MFPNTFIIFSLWSSQAIFILRAVVGLVFIAHGWPKIKNIKESQANFVNMGFKPGALWGTVVAILEFFGGLAIFLGFYTQAIAILIAFEMAIAAIWKIRKGQGFVSGYELDVLLIAAALALATLGSGAYALEYLI
jgi:uncharacterized membrane protein YphA (DoxX/SURF4 family)